MVTTHDIEVHNIHYDSRKIQKGDLFVALKGTNADGHKFIEQAIENGAKTVVIENDAVLPDSFFMHAGVAKIVVADARRALAVMSANFYGHPARKLKLIGVTGTNGKTTTTYLIKQLLEHSPAFRGKVGLIGTIEYVAGDQRMPATHTTPESLELNQLFLRMVEKQCTHVVMEVSSHSLQQHRVYGLEFEAAVFTNLTQDHLDYHGTMESYFASKKILFDDLPASSVAITNADDAWGLKITRDTHGSILTYGIAQRSDLHATNISMSIARTNFVIEHRNDKIEITSQLVGRFNIQNILAACSVGIALGIPAAAIQSGVASLTAVPGRFERIVSPAGWTAIIDYAHTPDALEKCLSTIHDVLPADTFNKIITVFGAGGDRDKTKRPLMGKAVEAMSDIIIVTSDNPRTENPQAIIDEVRAGIQRQENVFTESDRRNAIAKAASMARKGDVVLVAGKGHEDYQVIGTTKHHFSDREVVSEVIASTAQ